MTTRTKACIRSGSSFGIAAYELIKQNLDIEVVAFMENASHLSVNEIRGIPVFSQYAVIKKYRDKEIDKIIIPGNLSVYTLLSIERELKCFDVSKEDIIIIPAYLMVKKGERLTSDEKKEIMEHHEFNYLKYLEFHVADHCNLNCDNCSHFSSFVKEPSFPELTKVRKDFERIRELVDNIYSIRILGGESLLNPELDKYIEMVKEFFPCARLAVVTNGLLLRSISEKLMECIRNNDVQIDISSYPPLWNTMDEIVEFLRKQKIHYSVSEPIGFFGKVVDFEKKKAFPYRTLTNLPVCVCKNLYKGKMAICPITCYSKFYDQHYNIEKMTKLSADGVVDIYDITSFEELEMKLEKPCALCDYCTIYRSSTDAELQERWHQIGK